MTPLAKNKKVLVIENDSDLLDVIQEALSYEGFKVSTLLESENIITEVLRDQPDVVILDYILNGINGGELCHQLKTNNSTCQLPVVLMSAYPRVLKSLGDYGCDAFIAKPFNLCDVVACLQNLTANTFKNIHATPINSKQSNISR